MVINVVVSFIIFFVLHKRPIKSETISDRTCNISKTVSPLSADKSDIKGKSKKAKLKGLTKKQRKKIRMTKANRIIYPHSRVFMNHRAEARSKIISCKYKKIISRYIHDGYSWELIKAPYHASGMKWGELSFKTRALSPIKFSDKGLSGKTKMTQLSTYKVKNPKVKRKK